jgi:hypothetical protein
MLHLPKCQRSINLSAKMKTVAHKITIELLIIFVACGRCYMLKLGFGKSVASQRKLVLLHQAVNGIANLF